MLKRYQTWTEANPLLDWLLSVGLGLAVFLTLFFLIPGTKTPGTVMLIVVIVLSGPTTSLSKRFSEERRQANPISPSQEKGVGWLAILISVCSIVAHGLCILGKQWDWPINWVAPLLMVWSVSFLLSLIVRLLLTAAGRI